MAKKYIYQHRRATTEEWERKKDEIVPYVGELVIEICDNKFHKLKIGDGEHKYSELKYLMAGDEVVTQALPRTVTVTLDKDSWTQVTSASDPNFGYYGQTVSISDSTNYSKLDLQPDADMLSEFKDLDLVFVTENQNGTIKVYSIGETPTKTYVMQAIVTETNPVVGVDKIIGATVGTPVILSEKNYATESRVNELVEDFVTTNGYVTESSIPDLVKTYLDEMLEGEY